MRADVYLSMNFYTSSRQKAKVLIEEGNVYIDNKHILKPSLEIDESYSHSVKIVNHEKYVSRGGYKLEKALSTFRISVYGSKCIDIGSSTGGFTDCLLQNGALHVTCVDSGSDQLAESIREDKRVSVFEKYNARTLSPDDVGGDYRIAVMDVSFISQTYIIPNIPKLLSPNAHFVSLLKPQFEAGREAVGKNGIVRQRKDHFRAAMRVRECAEAFGLYLVGFARSPILGGDGNTEYLMHFSNKDGCDTVGEETIMKIIG